MSIHLNLSLKYFNSQAACSLELIDFSDPEVCYAAGDPACVKRKFNSFFLYFE